MENRRIHWPRVLAEFFAILAGVTLALLADDWREYRNDRVDEGLALEEIAADLEADSVHLALLFEKAQATDQSVLWLLRHLEEDLPEDSVMARYAPLHYFRSYAPVRSGYDGLMDSGRLPIIRDHSLRRQIVDYDEVEQPSTVFYFDWYMHTYEYLRDTAAPHLRMVPDPVGESFRASFEFHFVRPWSEVSSDYSHVYRIEMMGHLMSAFAYRLGPTIGANSELRRLILGSLR